MSASSVATKPALTPLRWPRSVMARFVARRTVRSATFIALAFGAVTASKVIGYADVYPTTKDRAAAAAVIVGNAGFKALFGAPHHLESLPGYTSWYVVAMGVLLGGIWAYLVATRTFRGEETAGRWEPLLAGLTTARRAAAGALVGLGASLLLFYLIAAASLIAIGHAHNIGLATGPTLYLALAAVAPAVMFMAVGAFASQFMPTRARAAGLATAIFGLSYMARAAGDVTSAHWLTSVSPLGWVEQLQPLVDPQPIWLLPIAAFTLALAAATIWLAGRRDLGEAVFADRDTSRPHTALLGGPLTSAFRLTRASIVSWLAALAVFVVYYGALTGTATKIFSSTPSAQQLLARLVDAGQNAGARAFIGIGFMTFMMILMAYAASAVGAMRSDESQGYLDNLLVRPVGRQRWLWGRVGLITVVLVIGAMLIAVFSWLGMGSHHYGMTFRDLWIAGLNTLPPSVFTLGVGLFAFGVLPRLTTVIAYSVLAWSFLIQLLSSGTNLSHWLLDTSLFTHIAFAPAADPKWTQAAVIVVIGVLLAVVGAFAFNRRDLASE